MDVPFGIDDGDAYGGVVPEAFEEDVGCDLAGEALHGRKSTLKRGGEQGETTEGWAR